MKTQIVTVAEFGKRNESTLFEVQGAPCTRADAWQHVSGKAWDSLQWRVLADEDKQDDIANGAADDVLPIGSQFSA
jgi:hypothetical protein